MHQSKKGNDWHVGMKAHIGVDAASGLVHRATVHSVRLRQSGTGWPAIQTSLQRTRTGCHAGIPKICSHAHLKLSFCLFRASASDRTQWHCQRLACTDNAIELNRYIVVNPMRARIVGSLDAWPWTNHRYFIGKAPLPGWLEHDWLLAQFGTSGTLAIAADQNFVMAGIDKASPLAETRRQIHLTDDGLVSKYQQLQQSAELLETVPAARAAVPLLLADYRIRYPDRVEAVAAWEKKNPEQ